MKIFLVKDNYDNPKLTTRVIDEEKPFNHVEIFQKSGYGIYGSKDKRVYGINWSAKGTVSVEETEEYIKLLQVAVREAKKANK